MKHGTAVVVLAAFAGTASALTLAASASAEASADAWLRQHRAAQPDELAELRVANPQAYAIVKALLTKRSLGLLDPKHPSASFAPAPSARAPADFEAVAAPKTGASDEEEAPTAAAAPAARHDWLNWRPSDSATADEAMVSNVLGAAADLKSQRAPLRDDGSGDEAKAASAPAAPTAAPTAQAPPASASDSNPYLNALGVSASVGSRSEGPSQNDLSSFSWDGSSQRAAVPVPAKQAAAAAPRPKNALLNWLTSGKKVQTEGESAKAPAQTEVAAQDENPYLSSLQ